MGSGPQSPRTQGTAEPAGGEAPVFVIGSSRSGTTLVYSLLLSSGAFPLYEEGETHLLECRRTYGSLRSERAYRRFLEDWLRSRQFQRSGLDASEFRRLADRCRTRGYEAILGEFMNAMARREGRRRWAEKTPAHVFHLPALGQAFPTARVVHVIRDGRDVALSTRRLGWSGTRNRDPLKQLICAATAWRQAVRAGRRWGARHPERYLEIRYEDVIADSVGSASRLSSFAGVAIRPPTEAEPSRRVGALREGFSAFEPSVSGISQAPVRRWATSLSPREQAYLHVAAGPLLERLGYDVPEVRLSGRERARAAWLAARYRIYLHAKRWAVNRTPLGLLAASRLEL